MRGLTMRRSITAAALLLFALAACEKKPDTGRRPGPGPGPRSSEKPPSTVSTVESFSPEKAASEKEWIPHRTQQLERIMARGTFPDILVTRDGKRVEGRVADDGGTHVQLETPYGRVPVLRAVVKEVRSGGAIHTDFKWRVAKADLPQVFAWAKEQALSIHREYLGYRLLARDSSEEAARQAAGYRRSGQAWQLRPELLIDGESAARSALSREEFQQALEHVGYLLRDGRWHVGAAWSTQLDSLHVPGSWKWTLEGAEIWLVQQGVYPQHVLQDIDSQRSKIPARVKFFGPSRREGAVSIEVDAPSEWVRCEIKALTEIVMDLDKKKFGKIEVFVTPDGGPPVPVFATDDQLDRYFHDITPHVKGKRKFTVYAKMTTKIDKYHTYARFLPGTPEDKEVLVVRGEIVQPAPDLDAMWSKVKP